MIGTLLTFFAVGLITLLVAGVFRESGVLPVPRIEGADAGLREDDRRRLVVRGRPEVARGVAGDARHVILDLSARPAESWR